MSNFTAPSSRIFNRSDWQSSWFLMFTRFMMSKVFRGFSRRAIRIFSRSVIGVPCIGFGDGTCCTDRPQRLHSLEGGRFRVQKAKCRAICKSAQISKSAHPLKRPLQIDEFSLSCPCRAPQRLRRLTEGADESAPHALGVAEAGCLRDELDRLARGLHALARDLDAQALDGLRGRRAGLGGKGAGKMPRTHASAVGEIFDRQAGVEVLARPGQQRAEAPVRRLQFQK